MNNNICHMTENAGGNPIREIASFTAETPSKHTRDKGRQQKLNSFQITAEKQNPLNSDPKNHLFSIKKLFKGLKKSNSDYYYHLLGNVGRKYDPRVQVKLTFSNIQQNRQLFMASYKH